MKKIFLFVIIFLHFSIHCFSQPAKGEQEIQNLSKRKFEWMIHKNLDSLGLVLDERLQYVHSNGWVQTKKNIIEDLNSGKLIVTSVEITEASVRLYDNTAILNGKGKFIGSVNEKPFSLELMYNEVYIKAHKKWLLVSRHANKLQ